MLDKPKGPARRAGAEPLVHPADAVAVSAEILEKLTHSVGKDPVVAKNHDWLAATILALRDRIIDRWMATTR